MKKPLTVTMICIGLFLGALGIAIGCFCLFGDNKERVETVVSEIPPLPLIKTSWQLLEMDGQTREMLGADSTAFTFELVDSVNLVTGRGACNRFFGEYSHNLLDSLSFRIQGRTQMFCPNLEYEDLFIGMLDSVRTYRIKADTLYLYDGNNMKSATLVGRAPMPASAEW